MEHAIEGSDSLNAVVQHYFDGLYFNNTSLLAQIFHPNAIYVCANSDDFQTMNMTEYFAVLKNRTSPASLGQARADKVLWTNITNKHMAVVSLECAIAPKHFKDCLTFVNTGEGWQIISKVFTYSKTHQSD